MLYAHSRHIQLLCCKLTLDIYSCYAVPHSRHIQFALIETYFSKCDVGTKKQTTPKPHKALYKHKTYRQEHNHKNKSMMVAFCIT
jgi:hypothetical protein